MVSNSGPDTRAARDPQYIAGWLSAAEFEIVEAICETFLPALTPPVGSSEEQSAYYQRSARDLHIAMLFAETLGREDANVQVEFHRLLKLLASSTISLLLVGRPRAFVELAFEQREQYLLAMATSPVGQLRQGYQAMKRLTGFIFYSVPDAHGSNANWAVLDYSVPVLEPREAEEGSGQALKPLSLTEDVVLECDAVVIGSGAGGGVVAGELAMAGKSVIVLEKGSYYQEADFTLQEAQAMSDLYLKRGTQASKDLSTIILAGSVLGGGTVVNWCTSFRTPADVLAEWAQISGLDDFSGPALQKSFETVERRLHVNSENSVHNRQNQLLMDGAERLKYHAGTLPRNADGCDQRCGTCGFGCRYGCKQSTTKTYLQDAYEHGARFIVNCSAHKVIVENEKAVGVEASALNVATGQSYRVTVYARVVVVAAGSLHSPAVLLRSGLENRHIGKHLHLHPTSTISGSYAEKIYGWKGVMQSAYSDEFAHLSGNYGYTLEVPPTHPGLLGLATPWSGARAYRERMAQAAQTGTIIVLTRDKGEGHIALDRAGEPVVHYAISAFDRRHLLHGLCAAARIHMAAGAQEVISLHSRLTTLRRPENGMLTEKQWDSFGKQLKRRGTGPNRVIMFSAHQMGTCRMGKDPKEAVINGNCEVYGVKGLFVCDGSVFPAASGVNPMLSIMALAHRASQHIKSVL